MMVIGTGVGSNGLLSQLTITMVASIAMNNTSLRLTIAGLLF